MKKYFYLKNGQQVGPFSYDELWNQKIAPNTKVWCEGMPEWKNANTIHEFANWFPQQAIAQKRPQQPIRKPQQSARPIQRKPVKRKKSYRGIIGVAVFLISVVFILYLYNQKSSDPSDTSKQKVAVNSKSKSGTKKSIQKSIEVIAPEFSSDDNFTIENYPLHPEQMGNRIAEFLGTARKSTSQAKLLYFHPDTEESFQYIIDTYSEKAIKLFLQGPVPLIKYQSLTSALVIFYNPWNDLVMLTDWQLAEGQIFITDIELVTTDFLKYDGLNIMEGTPLWARDLEALPIDALSNSVEQRAELFDRLWGEPTGTGNWRKVLTSLSSPVYLINNQAEVAFRLRDQYLGMQYLMKANEMNDLRKLFTSDMKNLHSKNKLEKLLNAGPNTPDIVRENFSLYPPEIWKLASFQIVRNVPEGAFVFVTTPKLTKTFLSFYYKRDSENKLFLNRMDWCTFDNEL